VSRDVNPRIRMLQHNLLRLKNQLDRSDKAVADAADLSGSSDVLDVIADDSRLDPFSPDYMLTGDASEATKKRGRAAVICWDLGHNPVGRAIVLYDLLREDWDVELIGPLWSRFGGEVWSPIVDSDRIVRSLVCESLEEFYPAAVAFAETNFYDLVVVSKPRAPSLALGAIIKQNSKCPMVLDVDDLELSFADSEDSVSEAQIKKNLVLTFKEPYESMAIRYCDPLIKDADSVTVSNIALRERYGGHMVRHARDGSVFDPARYDRQTARKKLGLKTSDFALMFVGTPRPHKGIFTVAKALDELGDERFVLNIVGDINYPGMQEELESFKNARINFYPGCSFTQLPDYMAAADVVPLLQEVDSEIAQYQIPAKISDATAFGIPIVMTEVPPIYDLEQQKLVKVIHPDFFGETLLELYDQRSDKDFADTQARIRAGFKDEFGFKINRIRLDNAIELAIARNRPVSKGLALLVEHMRSAYLKLNDAKRSKPKPAIKGKKDLVMFWKQNDSGLYGRRSDMIMKHLLKGNHFGRILQFDAPINLEDLAKMAEKSDGPLAPSGLAAHNAVQNKFHRNDTDRHFLRTYIWSDSFKNSTLIDGTSLELYPIYVEEQMIALGFDPKNTIAWVCPVVFDFPQITEAINFSMIVSDIIDDQRAFDLSPSERRRVENNYETILPMSDVVMTNCQPNVESFMPLTGEIHFVPNGTEIPSDDLPMPAALEGIARPIAGYVGNLQDRIDWDLLDEAAHHVPDVSFVIAGGGARPQNVERLNKRHNVHFLGVVPYDKVQAYIQHFDVCIVPHKGTDLTRRMNPLKVYNYFAAKKPIVTTEVENIDGIMSPYIRFARNAGELAVFIKECLEHPQKIDEDFQKVLNEVTWDSRINHIMSILSPIFEEREQEQAEPAIKKSVKTPSKKKTTAKPKSHLSKNLKPDRDAPSRLSLSSVQKRRDVCR